MDACYTWSDFKKMIPNFKEEIVVGNTGIHIASIYRLKTEHLVHVEGWKEKYDTSKSVIQRYL